MKPKMTKAEIQARARGVGVLGDGLWRQGIARDLAGQLQVAGAVGDSQARVALYVVLQSIFKGLLQRGIHQGGADGEL